jgi:hypothetical protein
LHTRQGQPVIDGMKKIILLVLGFAALALGGVGIAVSIYILTIRRRASLFTGK